MSWDRTTSALFKESLKTAVDTAMSRVATQINQASLVPLYPQLYAGTLICTMDEHLRMAGLDKSGAVATWLAPEACEYFKRSEFDWWRESTVDPYTLDPET
jgi:hypothetical protein